MTEQLKSAHALQKNSYLFSGNGAYLEALYEQYLHDPSQLSAEWQTYFNQLSDKENHVSHAHIRASFAKLAQRPVVNKTISTSDLQYKLLVVIQAYRRYGHYQAHLDPLALAAKREVADLSLEN